MSKKKKRRVVQGLGSIPTMSSEESPPTEPAKQSAAETVQPSRPPSSPPPKQQRTTSKKSAAKPVVRKAPASTDSQLESTRRSNYFGRWFDAVNDFWFTPRSPRMLGVIRILTGVLLLYSLAVWTLELSTFFATEGLLPLAYRQSNCLLYTSPSPRD